MACCCMRLRQRQLLSQIARLELDRTQHSQPLHWLFKRSMRVSAMNARVEIRAAVEMEER